MRFSRVFILFAILPFAGCSLLGPWTGNSRGSASGDKADKPTSILTAKTGAGGIRHIGLVFDVVRIDLPMRGIQHSRKIWNHVDELRHNGASGARLARNGLRIGAAAADAWPAIRTIIEAADGEVRRNQFVAQRDMPLVIELDTIGEDESIFSYRSGNRLVGKTFSTGRKLLGVDYVVHSELIGCVDLRATFEVRHDRGVMTWERQEGVIRQVPDVERHAFDDVSALVTLNPDEFLVIGLDDSAKNEYLIGGRFLTIDRQGQLYETVICITPHLRQEGRAAG